MLKHIKMSNYIWTTFIIEMLNTLVNGLIVGYLTTYQGKALIQIGLDMNLHIVYSSIFGLVIFSRVVRSMSLLTLYKVLLVIGVFYPAVISLWFIDHNYFIYTTLIIGPVWMTANVLFLNRIDKVIADHMKEYIVDLKDSISAYGKLVMICSAIVASVIPYEMTFCISVVVSTIAIYYEVSRLKILKQYV